MHRMGWRARLLSLYLTSLILPQIRGAQVNVTIDDQYGDPTTGQLIQYNPSQSWQTGQDCEPCTAKPRPIRNAHNETWMDGSYFPPGPSLNGAGGQIVSATVPFIGVAAYVQVILTGSEQFPTGNSDMTFLIDNSAVGSFVRAPNGDPSYEFNQTVFAMAGLSNSLHTITIELGHSGNRSLILLDSIIYTKEIPDGTGSSPSDGDASDSDSESDSNTNIAVIAGPVVGGVIVGAALIALLFFLRRRRQGQRVRVLLDSPPMQSISPARGGSTAQRRNNILGQEDSYNATSPTNYSRVNAGWVDAASMHESYNPYMATSHANYNSSRVDGLSMHESFAPGPAPSEYHYNPTALNHASPPSQSSGSYGVGSRADESVVSANAPLSPLEQSPPAYSEISHSSPPTSTDAPRMPHAYGQSGLAVYSR